MKTVVRPSSKRVTPKSPRPRVDAKTATARRKRSKAVAAKNAAIATELAPAVAIALLEKSEQLPGEPPAALDVLAVGVAPSANDGKVRVQLLFESGAVLPVEMSSDAGAALSHGLAGQLPKAAKTANTAKPRRAAKAKR